MTDPVKYVLDESRIPKRWYNIAADLPKPLPPPLHPGHAEAARPRRSRAALPDGADRAGGHARSGRSRSPSRCATSTASGVPRRSSARGGSRRRSQTPARIYYKYEGVSPAGSHKPNTAVAQAFYNQRSGRQEARDRDRRRPVGLGARVRRRAVRHRRAGLHGARVVRPEAVPPRADGDLRRALHPLALDRDAVRPRDPREEPEAPGLARHRDLRGGRGRRASRDDTKYSLGSVLNHVLLHQTVVGQEAMAQMEMAGDYPDVIVGCTGGGSNFAGIAFPFLGAQLRGGTKVRIVAIEPAACPSLTRGKYAYDFGDTAHLTPLVKMHTLGSTFTPPGFHAGGLRYHGMAPLVSHIKELGLIEAKAYQQIAVLRGRRAVRPRRGHPAGAGSEPRGEGRDRRGDPLQARKASRARSSSTCAATATSTCRPTWTTSPAS